MYISSDQIETYLKMAERVMSETPMTLFAGNVKELCLEILEGRRLREHEQQQGEQNEKKETETSQEI